MWSFTTSIFIVQVLANYQYKVQFNLCGWESGRGSRARGFSWSFSNCRLLAVTLSLWTLTVSSFSYTPWSCYSHGVFAPTVAPQWTMDDRPASTRVFRSALFHRGVNPLRRIALNPFVNIEIHSWVVPVLNCPEPLNMYARRLKCERISIPAEFRKHNTTFWTSNFGYILFFVNMEYMFDLYFYL